MSVAGGGLNASQQSSGQASQDGAVSQGSLSGPARRSTMAVNRGSVQGEGLMTSGSRGDGGMYGRTPSGRVNPPGSVRRSSSYSSQGRPSVAGPPMIGSLSSSSSAKPSSSSSSDPREIRTSAYMQQCRENVAEYLAARRCPHPFGPKYLTSPTTKEFQNMFKFLITDVLDPGFVWGKSFESDCVQILRDMKYPTPEQVGKTALSAAGAPNTWPPILAMLNWLVELSRAIDTWHDPELIADPCIMPIESIPDDTENIEDHLFSHFCASSFRKWFDGAEEFPEEESILRMRFDRMSEHTFEDSERNQTMLNKLHMEYQLKMTEESPLKRFEQDYLDLMSDKVKFVNYLTVNGEKEQRYVQKLDNISQALASFMADLERLEVEYKNLQVAYAQQNLSPEEVHRMNVENQTLSDGIRETKGKIQSLVASSYEHEIQSAKRSDEIDRLTKEYMELAYKIGLMGQKSKGLENIDFDIDVDMTATDLTKVQITGAIMKERIRPALQAYGDRIRSECQQQTNVSIELDDEHDRLASTVDAKMETVKTLEVKFKIANDYADDAKQKLQAETQDMQQRVAKLESDVSAMSMSSQQDLLAIESELERLKVARTELDHRTSQLRERIIAEMSMHLETMLKTKEHASTRLQELRNFAKTRK